MTAREKRSAKDTQKALDKLAKVEEERDILKAAIKRHHQQVVVQENWGADDELWDVLGLYPRPETKAA